MDFGTICLLGILFVVGALVLPRLMKSMGGNQAQRGNEQPRYDDPDVRTGGGFGGSGNQGGGGFRLPFGSRGSGQSAGTSRGGTAGGTMGSSRGRPFGRAMGGSKTGGTAGSNRAADVRRDNDEPDVRSGGGFGGSGS